MINRWLTWFNSVLVSIACVLLFAGGIFWLKRPSQIETTDLKSNTYGLPKGTFEQKPQWYAEMGSHLLALEEAAPTMQVPDLKSQLIYYGKNGRPDAQKDNTLFHISLSSNTKQVTSIAPGQSLYLIFDRSTTPGKYVFSPNNEKSSLWVTAAPVDNEIQVEVFFENDLGERINEPESNIQFKLQEKEFTRFAGTTWELGALKVDGTLLARQKARWYGPDKFLEQHGGQAYQDIQGRQRLDLGENDEIYSVFVKAGDTLIWDGKKWVLVEPGANSLGYPLLVVKKMDDRLLSFELWDIEGKGKVLLNVLKSTEPWTMQNAQMIQSIFKFVGAKTRTQCVFEINRERMILSPSDWLLLTPKGWKKLTSAEDIDNYVKRKTSGTLFVFEGVVRKDERQVVTGKIYSPSRHDYQDIEFAAVAGAKPREVKETAKETKNQDLKEVREVAELLGELLAPLSKQEGEAGQNTNVKQAAGSPVTSLNQVKDDKKK